jgi:RNA polymerase primary sigma factor
MRRVTKMTQRGALQADIPWLALLNCPEARVLSPREERELLVELSDCKNRIVAARLLRESDQGESDAGANFQQFVRELADGAPEDDLRSVALQPVAKRYQQIRSKLALANVRLVAHVAKRYHGRGIPPADLIQEGVCSLLFAIDRFEIVNETRLATYAIWWIRQGIQRAIATLAYPVRLSPRQLLRLAQLSVSGGDESWSRQGGARRARFDLPQPSESQTLERLMAATRPTLSLDARSRSDGVTALGDYLVPTEDDEARAVESDDSIGVLIENLDPREQLVLTLRFGLCGSEQQTLVQVSKVLGVSKERVRQIEARALRKLREMPRPGGHVRFAGPASGLPALRSASTISLSKP